VRRWLEQEYPRIRRQAREVGDIYFGDEAGVRSDSHAGTTWGIKGQTPVVRRQGNEFGQYDSAVSARATCVSWWQGRVNGGSLSSF